MANILILINYKHFVEISDRRFQQIIKDMQEKDYRERHPLRRSGTDKPPEYCKERKAEIQCKQCGR